ncbi:unnamed protein product [Effrenium voratum]|nr:unnamed protein product [Effrenium voratum]
MASQDSTSSTSSGPFAPGRSEQYSRPRVSRGDLGRWTRPSGTTTTRRTCVFVRWAILKEPWWVRSSTARAEPRARALNNFEQHTSKHYAIGVSCTSSPKSTRKGFCFDPLAVPTLVDREKKTVVVDSKAICQYLDQELPLVPLTYPEWEVLINKHLDLVDETPHMGLIYGLHFADDIRDPVVLKYAQLMKGARGGQLAAVGQRLGGELPPQLRGFYEAKRRKIRMASETLSRAAVLEMHQKVQEILGILEQDLRAIGNLGDFFCGTLSLVDVFWHSSLLRLFELGFDGWFSKDRLPRVHAYAMRILRDPVLARATYLWPYKPVTGNVRKLMSETVPLKAAFLNSCSKITLSLVPLNQKRLQMAMRHQVPIRFRQFQSTTSMREEMKNLQNSMEQYFNRQELLLQDLSAQIRSSVDRSKENRFFQPRPTCRTKNFVSSSALNINRVETERASRTQVAKTAALSPMKKSGSQLEKVVSEPMENKRRSARMSFARTFFTEHMMRANAAAAQEFFNSPMTTAELGEPSFCGRVRRCSRAIVSAPITAHLVMFLILLNLVMLGVEVDVAASLGVDDVPGYFEVMNVIIVVVFVAELMLNFIGFGFQRFFCGPDCWWNCFDFAIIGLSVCETVVQLWAPGLVDEMRYMRFLRLARALRGMRVVKLLRYVSALRTLIFSIISTTGSLMWTLVLLILLFYSFGVILTQIVTDHCRQVTILQTGDKNAVPMCPAELERFWSSISESMLTLYMAISGGVSWIEPLQPLREVSELAVFCLLLYVVLTVFAVLNVVTGVFCHTAIESATADKEIVVMSQMQKQAAQVSALREMFKEMDKDGSGVVSVEELKGALGSEKVSSFLESMDIATTDVWTLFMIIDQDQNGLIDIDEFVNGCMQLHGPAKSIQLARMSHENKVTRQSIKKLINEIIELRSEVQNLTEEDGSDGSDASQEEEES